MDLKSMVLLCGVMWIYNVDFYMSFFEFIFDVSKKPDFKFTFAKEKGQKSYKLQPRKEYIYACST